MIILNFLLKHFELVVLIGFVFFAWWRISLRKQQEAYAHKVLKKAVDSNLVEPMTLHPEIDPKLCAGCGACTRVCPEGDILKLIEHKAALVAPTKCVGHGECERACPFSAVSLVFGTKTRGLDIPRVTTNYETNVPGIYIAGELGGMGLIRNAVKQGALATKHAIEKLKPGITTDTDVFIVGAGPAGLAASLQCVANRVRYACIDQNTFGGTVYNFPRQKIVMTHPADLPMVGEMKFPSNKVSKEELLAYWNQVKRKAGIEVSERVRFIGLENHGDHFTIETSVGKIKAQKVILATGVRGTPRRLGLPNEDLQKVTYNLIDADQYQMKDVFVVGGGNAGVEAAQMLAKQGLKNRVVLSLRGEQFDRCNEENKRKIKDLEAKGLVKIWYKSQVKEIHADKLVVQHDTESKTIPNDFLFVFAGAEIPSKFLMSLGVDIEKKYGEALEKKSS